MFQKLANLLNGSANLRVVTSSEAVSSLHFFIVVNPDWACCFCLKNGLFFNRFSKFTKTVKKEADIFTKLRCLLSDGCG